MEYNLPYKRDNKGRLYLDDNDIKIYELYVKQMSREHAHFFGIEGNDKIIIKDCTVYPRLFNRYQNLLLLDRLVKKQPEISKVDFPFGYYQKNGELKGILNPYYKDAPSINEVTSLYTFDELRKFYDHETDDIDNFLSLLLDILDLLNCLFEKGIYYLDIHSGNFLIFNNEVKVVDFEPGHVYFRDKKWNLDLMLLHYGMLVDKLRRRYKFKDIYFNHGIDFYNAEQNVKALKKKLER